MVSNSEPDKYAEEFARLAPTEYELIVMRDMTPADQIKWLKNKRKEKKTTRQRIIDLFRGQ